MIKKLFLTLLLSLFLTTSVFGIGFDSDTKLLIHFDGSDGSTDDYTAETGQTVSLVGTAQLDTAVKKFGTASLLLDGNSDYATVPDSADWSFGTGNFTIDAWVRYSTDPTGAHFAGWYDQYVDANNVFNIWIYDNQVRFIVKSGGSTIAYCRTDTGDIIVHNTMHHVAVVRYGTSENNLLIFVDGVSQTLSWYTAMAANATMPDIASTLRIGYTQWQGKYFPGNIDEVRVSKGIARWTANFTPPVSEYTWRRIISIQ